MGHTDARARPLIAVMAVMAVIAFCVACANKESAASPTDAAADSACEPGWSAIDGVCFPKFDDCGAGEVPQLGGGCKKVGVPVDGCAPGFTHDGASGCAASLPKNPCGAGSIAVPGDVACREVAACGTGTWGTIPVDASTLYVDRAYVGGGSDGSSSKPYLTIGAALDAAPTGKPSTVAIAAGSYAEHLRIVKPVRLWGRCPSMVEVKGLDSATNAIDVVSPSELHRLAVTGPSIGVLIEDAGKVVVDELWIHDTGDRGLDLEGDVDGIVRNTLVEHAQVAGIVVIGSTASIDRVAVRDTAMVGGKNGFGVLAQDDAKRGKRSDVELRGSLVQRSVSGGVMALGSVVRIEACAILDTKTGAPGSGAGLAAQNRPSTKMTSDLTARATVVERAQGVAVSFLGSTAVLDRMTIRDTQAARDKRFGEGIEVREGSTMTMSDSLVVGNTTAGVNVIGVKATIERSIIRGTGAQPLDATFGMGIVASPDNITSTMADLVLRDSVVEQSHTCGIGGYGVNVTLERTIVRDTPPQVSDGLFGDGLLFVGAPGAGEDDLYGTLTMTTSVVVRSARAGINVQGSQLALQQSLLGCDAFDLEVGRKYGSFHGAWVEHGYAVDDRGGNACGCGATRSPCHALADELEPVRPPDRAP